MSRNTDNDSYLFSPGAMQPESIISTNDPQVEDIYQGLIRSIYDSPSHIGNTHQAYYSQSPTINPIYFLSNSHGTPDDNKDFFKMKVLISPQKSSKPIMIITHPRKKFRPRTEKESQESSHYIRTEDDIQPKYPTIQIEPEWMNEKSVIEVSLMTIDQQPHRYSLENKERQRSSLIFKEETAVNSLYFHVTEDDCRKGQKTFLMEYIKPKQEGEITKDFIRLHRLDQSMLRFTRFYQLLDGSYQRDEATSAYSSIMTEDYGNFNVDDVFPLYGPMNGSNKLCVEFKGNLPKDLVDNCRLILSCDELKWSCEIDRSKKRKTNLTFLMPLFPFHQLSLAKVDLCIQYKDEIIREATYLYTRHIDEAINSADQLVIIDDEWSMMTNQNGKRARC